MKNTKTTKKLQTYANVIMSESLQSKKHENNIKPQDYENKNVRIPPTKTRTQQKSTGTCTIKSYCFVNSIQVPSSININFADVMV